MDEFDYLSSLAEDGDNVVQTVAVPQEADSWFDEDQLFGWDR